MKVIRAVSECVDWRRALGLGTRTMGSVTAEGTVGTFGISIMASKERRFGGGGSFFNAQVQRPPWQHEHGLAEPP